MWSQFLFTSVSVFWDLPPILYIHMEVGRDAAASQHRTLQV